MSWKILFKKIESYKMKHYTERALEIWHQHFSDEKHHYSEFEKSDIEYFIAVLLYNQFSFKKALETMKTMEIANDFLEESGETFNEVVDILSNITFQTDEEAVEFLLDFIRKSKSDYTPSECYLLNRIENHVQLMKERYENNEEVKTVDFTEIHEKIHPALKPQAKI